MKAFLLTMLGFFAWDLIASLWSLATGNNEPPSPGCKAVAVALCAAACVWIGILLTTA